MMTRLRRDALLAGLLAATLVVGCSSGGDAKRSELKAIEPTVSLRTPFQGKIGASGLASLRPAIVGQSLFAASASGDVARFDGGKEVWRAALKQPLSGGVATDGKVVVVGSPEGDVIALSAEDGRPLWLARVTSEVLAPAAIADGLVVVRSGDHRLFGFDAADGSQRWVYQRTTPALAVRTTAAPRIADKLVFAGFPGGKLVALTTTNGGAVWEGSVSLPKGATELERIADVVAEPVLGQREVCAVSFQGRLACFDLANGNTLWTRDVSSSVGLAIDSQHVYVTDDQGIVQAFDRSSGASAWKQDALRGRNPSGPTSYRNLVAVGDDRGIMHFLRKEDGAFAARGQTDGSPVLAAPVLADSAIAVQTRQGGLFAFEAD